MKYRNIKSKLHIFVTIFYQKIASPFRNQQFMSSVKLTVDDCSCCWTLRCTSSNRIMTKNRLNRKPIFCSLFSVNATVDIGRVRTILKTFTRIGNAEAYLSTNVYRACLFTLPIRCANCKPLCPTQCVVRLLWMISSAITKFLMFVTWTFRVVASRDEW